VLSTTGTAPAGPEADATSPSLSAGAATATARIAALLPTLETVWGTSGSRDGELMLPFGVAVDDNGQVYVSDSTGAQKFTADGQFVLRFGPGELKTALGGIAVSHDGRVYVSGFDQLVHVYASDGTPLGALGEAGTEPGQLAKPVDVAVDGAGKIYVADAGNARVEVYAPGGEHLLTVGSPGEGKGQFRMPRAVEVGSDGTIYVGQGDDFLVQRFGPDGTYLDTFGDAHAGEVVWRTGGIAVDPDGNAYVTQAMAHHIQRYEADAGYSLAWETGELGFDREQLSTPLGIEYQDGRLYVVDQQNSRIKVYRVAD
jgi:outer membrane protein assembly factor BamB